MKNSTTPRSAALGLLLAAAALPAPLMAQEAQTVSPPTIAPAPAPAPAEAVTPPPAAATPERVFAAPSPVVQAVPPRAPVAETGDAEPAPAAAAPVRRAVPRAAPAPQAGPAPAAAAPVAAPVAAAPTPAPAPVTEVVPPAPEPVTTEAAPVETAASSSGGNTGLWVALGVAGVALIALIGFLFARRRRNVEEVYEQPDYVLDEPVAAPAAFAADPIAVAPEPVAVEETAARPWIDLGLRPIRADQAGGSVDVELTVSNSGDAPAHDVRLSTWMLAAPNGSDNEQSLIDARADAQVSDFDVAAGSDRSVDATLELPAGQVEGAFRPLVVAEARYPLPDGGEGRISATFEIGVSDDEIDAKLHDVLERV